MLYFTYISFSPRRPKIWDVRHMMQRGATRMPFAIIFIIIIMSALFRFSLFDIIIFIYYIKRYIFFMILLLYYYICHYYYIKRKILLYMLAMPLHYYYCFLIWYFLLFHAWYYIIIISFLMILLRFSLLFSYIVAAFLRYYYWDIIIFIIIYDMPYDIIRHAVRLRCHFHIIMMRSVVHYIFKDYFWYYYFSFSFLCFAASAFSSRCALPLFTMLPCARSIYCFRCRLYDDARHMMMMICCFSLLCFWLLLLLYDILCRYFWYAFAFRFRFLFSRYGYGAKDDKEHMPFSLVFAIIIIFDMILYKDIYYFPAAAAFFIASHFHFAITLFAARARHYAAMIYIFMRIIARAPLCALRDMRNATFCLIFLFCRRLLKDMKR